MMKQIFLISLMHSAFALRLPSESPEPTWSLASLPFDYALDAFNNDEKCQKLKPELCQDPSKELTVRVDAYCPTTRLAYVKNAKTNSKGVKKNMIDRCEKTVQPEEFFASVELTWNSSAPYAFTFVREPFARTVSAYGEIDAKASTQQDCMPALHKSKAKWWKIDRGEEPHRFETFLADFRNGLIPEGCAPGHATPQIKHSCGIPKQALSAIGRLEAFEDHMELIHRSATERQAKFEGKEDDISFDLQNLMMDDPSYRDVKEDDNEKVLRLATAQTRRLVCDMFAADYACFGYPLPKECSE